MTQAVRRIILAGAALAALVNGGCLVVAATAATAAAGGATYAYFRGQLYRDYPAGLDDAHAAARAAFDDLQMPVVRDEPAAPGQVFLEARTGTGHPVRVTLAVRGAAVPAEGPITHVSVRIGTFGDDDVSTKLLDRIDAHLTPRVAPQPAPELHPVAAPPHETPPPPLAH
jgi:hypothetical protein